MATNRYLGVNGNWGDSTNWSLGTVPNDGEDVVIDQSNQTITSGLNQTGVALASLTITAPVNIGGNGSSLIIGVTGTFKAAGGGAIYVSADTGVQAIVKTIVQQTSGQTIYLTGGSFTTVEVARGANCYVQSGAVVTTLTSAGGCTLDYNATGLTTLTQAAGNLVSYRNIATGNVHGLGSTLTTVTSAAVSTSLTVTTGATFYHRSSGTIASLTVHPGAVATSQGSQYSAFTLTNSNLWYGGTLFVGESEVATPTYTNPTAKIAYA